MIQKLTKIPRTSYQEFK